MNISDLLAPEAVIPALKAQSKKQLLQELAARASAQTGLPERKIFDTLMERERLGTTGVGQGIAIPHGRLGDVTRIMGVFARLETPIDYDAVDKEPVDLVFMLLAPENAGADHLKALARVSRLLRNQAAVEKLRATTKAEALYAILTEPTASANSQAA
jgi:PTS system nitrogen regulatory IIA component